MAKLGYWLSDDWDESARLILMDGVETFGEFGKRFREMYVEASIMDCRALYQRYRGWDDGRIKPTHNLETGERL